ncbi:MAG: type VI secretion system tube protein Hcp, partial [Actinobacteria bacterium]|nr:type VI secretion system tube protein Hcp [Actinomycetota bacterium]
IRHVNPRKPGEPGPGSGIPNRYENCVNCSIATDAVLSKNPASALPGLPTATAVIEQAFGRSFRNVASRDAIVSELRVAGNGARGVVHGIRDRGVGHVFNAVNQRGTVRFLDGQTGREASFAGFSRLRFLRTYP